MCPCIFRDMTAHQPSGTGAWCWMCHMSLQLQAGHQLQGTHAQFVLASLQRLSWHHLCHTMCHLRTRPACLRPGRKPRERGSLHLSMGQFFFAAHEFRMFRLTPFAESPWADEGLESGLAKDLEDSRECSCLGCHHRRTSAFIQHVATNDSSNDLLLI